MELIRINNLYKTYYLGEVDVPVLRGVTLSIKRGELVALMGASGSGKTTLMNILGCLDRPTDGEYWLDGEEMSKLTPNERALVRTAKLGFVFQSFNLLPRTTALNNVMMPLDYSPNHGLTATSMRFAHSLLQRVGLAERIDHEPSQMSGGQQQRVAIARALVNRPALVLADEPTGNLDSKTSVEILQMFRQLNAEGITVMLVTHDPKVATFADRVIRIKDGQIESDGAPDGPPPLPHAHQNGDHGSNGSQGSNGDAATALVGAAHAPSTVSAHENGQSNGQSNVSNGANGAHPVAATAVRESSPLPHTEPRLPTVEPAHEATHHLAPSVMAAMMPATFRTAFNALLRHKMRSLLTALGVIIGVGAVIAMVEIGQGSRVALQRQIATMGANMLTVQSGAASSGGVSFGIGSSMTLTPQDCDEILSQCPAVVEVAPLVRTRVQLVVPGANWTPNTIYGTTPSFLVIRDWTEMDEGDMFTDFDVSKANQVCVIGDTIRRNLFPDESPINQEIRLRNVAFRIVGVLSVKGTNSFGMDQDDIVLAPWTTIKTRVSASALANDNQSSAASKDTSQSVNTLNDLYPGSPAMYPIPSATELADRPQPVRFIRVDQIMVKAASGPEVSQAITQITSLLHERHHIRDGEPDDFNIRDNAEIARTQEEASKITSGLLLVTAFISLVVGGIGIMNIMLVSVTERTREIGLRMAVGARSYHILRQFLVEAVVLCLFGGAIGIILGHGSAILVSLKMRWPIQVSLPAIIAAVAVSATVGVVFGFYPAWKASRLDPIEALRYE